MPLSLSSSPPIFIFSYVSLILSKFLRLSLFIYLFIYFTLSLSRPYLPLNFFSLSLSLPHTHTLSLLVSLLLSESVFLLFYSAVFVYHFLTIFLLLFPILRNLSFSVNSETCLNNLSWKREKKTQHTSSRNRKPPFRKQRQNSGRHNKSETSLNNAWGEITLALHGGKTNRDNTRENTSLNVTGWIAVVALFLVYQVTRFYEVQGLC